MKFTAENLEKLMNEDDINNTKQLAAYLTDRYKDYTNWTEVAGCDLVKILPTLSTNGFRNILTIAYLDMVMSVTANELPEY